MTNKKMLAFHNDPATKDKYLSGFDCTPCPANEFEAKKVAAKIVNNYHACGHVYRSANGRIVKPMTQFGRPATLSQNCRGCKGNS